MISNDLARETARLEADYKKFKELGETVTINRNCDSFPADKNEDVWPSMSDVTFPASGVIRHGAEYPLNFD